MAPIRSVMVIVAIYLAVFFVMLPALLWTLGGRFDVLFRLTPFGSSLQAPGVALFATGVVLMLWSIGWLWWVGRGLPISHLPPMLLVRGGPYAAMRHPIYVGYWIAFVGAGIVSASPGRALGAGTLLAVAAVIYAVGFEEPRLVARFGALYRSYQKDTALLPFPARRQVKCLLFRWWRASRSFLEGWANRPVLMRTGPALWVTYGFCAALTTGLIAVAVAGALGAVHMAPSRIAICLLGTTAATAIGSRLFWLGTWWKTFRRTPVATLRRVGFVSWGGFIGLLGFQALYAFGNGVNPLWLLDRTLPFALMGQALNRFGCLTYGCCYGRPSSLGILWTAPESKVVREHGNGNVRRFPAQLLELALSVATFAVVILTADGDAAPGAITGLVMLSYAVGRIGIETVRDEPLFTPWRLTQGQIVASVLGVVALGVLIGTPTVAGASASQLDYRAAWEALPFILASMLMSLLVFGLHWRRVGSW